MCYSQRSNNFEKASSKDLKFSISLRESSSIKFKQLVDGLSEWISYDIYISTGGHWGRWEDQRMDNWTEKKLVEMDNECINKEQSGLGLSRTSWQVYTAKSRIWMELVKRKCSSISSPMSRGTYFLPGNTYHHPSDKTKAYYVVRRKPKGGSLLIPTVEENDSLILPAIRY